MMISGNNYTIAELFSGNFIIEIPDMQRDYCWATTISDNNHKSLIFNFIEGLKSHIKRTETLQMGLLYAYESPKYHLQLCDGQQRMTTIYLMLGCLYQRLKGTVIAQQIQSVLVYPNEVITTPRFQYSIRETTLSFLTDLLANHWLIETYEKQNIEQSSWYFSEYKQDPSIQNIIIALKTINNCLNDLSEDDKIRLAGLLLNKVSFLYFDMVNRTYGEEQFVVLNTTGKPLSKTENLKPKFLGELNDAEIFRDNKTKLQYYSDMWEGWEYYFWKNKNTKHSTSDKGLNEFLRWVFIIENTQIEDTLSSEKEKYKAHQKALANNIFDMLSIQKNAIEDLLEIINSYFQALNKLTSDNSIKTKFLFLDGSLSQIQCLEFLPLLSYIKAKRIDISDRSYIRLKQFLVSRAKDENVSKATITLAIEAIKLAKIIENKDIADPSISVSSVLLNAHEKNKFEIYRHAENRDDLEHAFWAAEAFNCSNGNISYMLTIVNPTNSIENFPINSFKKLSSIVDKTLNQPTDDIRRALLTFGNYMIYHGWTTNLQSPRYSLGETSDFFAKMLNSDTKQAEVCHEFLKTALKANIKLDDWIKSRIKDYKMNNEDITSKLISKLIKTKNYLEEATKKFVCISDTKAYVLRKQNVTSDESYITIK